MEWVMLIGVTFGLYQVDFQTGALCEDAKIDLVEHHGFDDDEIACLQVSEGGLYEWQQRKNYPRG